MQILMSGLIFGCIYGLTALGLVLIYKTTDIVNFAQGEMAMVTTFVSFVFLSNFGFGYIPSLLLALIFAAIFGIAIHQIVMKRVQSAPPLNQIVVTLGLFMILNGMAGLIWGHKPTSYPQAVKGDSIKLGSVFITPNELFILCITFFLMLIFFLLFRFTRVGLAMRASAQDIKASQLMGIKVTSVFTATWAVGAILGGVAGIMTAPITFLDTQMMFEVLIMAFAAAVIGGFVSLPGAVIGGLFIGVFENLIAFYISPEMKLVYTFLLIILVLYIRPQGIFGGKQTLKKV
ncbi:branched-chain amino acid ABC transporter permease [Paenibacillus sp. BSR1-1]|uniref:branched-chain amino acid ABC transporter permease n=1 Tax=Paenibacillus sp. BSR1-1 TaxID=3020845 RepID=UPI0025B1A4C3|nr:branched-chain amino acid ABC transporter permease [Paenibacillus sp. BSR1-1]MDN3016182.1 branched-chain amino acid ABC transporter permease [Paenibacillus sp. BSR1-1]